MVMVIIVIMTLYRLPSKPPRAQNKDRLQSVDRETEKCDVNSGGAFIGASNSIGNA